MLLLTTFPGLTPMNVWDMRLLDFMLLAYHVDHREGGTPDG